MAGDDDTVRVRPAPVMRRPKPRWWLYGGVAAVVLLGVAGGALAYFGRAPEISIGVQSEAQIDAAQPCGIEVSRFSADPQIVVIDFPSLTVQGLMLDRVAALVEKAGLPRGRVLGDAALTQAIYNCGDTIESYYYGHDYQAADLRRFFALADADGVTLNKRELWLKGLLTQLGWMEPGAIGAIITLPASGGPVDPGMRAVILHHELSHGAFYTDPAYAAYATAFWNSLTSADRAAFTAFLGRQGYDAGNTRLILNETQAYLIFTRDPRFFNAAAVGMTDAAVANLRAGFIAGMPIFWLTPMANAALPNTVQAPGASCPSRSGQ
jgi:hypothetical protein